MTNTRYLRDLTRETPNKTQVKDPLSLANLSDKPAAYFARDTDSSSSVSNTSTTLLLVASINDDDVADRMRLKTGMYGEKLRRGEMTWPFYRRLIGFLKERWECLLWSLWWMMGLVEGDVKLGLWLFLWRGVKKVKRGGKKVRIKACCQGPFGLPIIFILLYLFLFKAKLTRK